MKNYKNAATFNTEALDLIDNEENLKIKSQLMEELQYVYYRLKSLLNFKGLIEKIDDRCNAFQITDFVIQTS